jgi:hypothetical protein
VEVRVGAGQRIPALLTLAARSRLRPVADEPLAEPERKALLPHTARSMQQERTGQRVAPDGGVEAGAESRVAVEGEERHGGKVGG